MQTQVHRQQSRQRQQEPAAHDTAAPQAQQREARALVASGQRGLARLGRPAPLPFRAQLERSFGTDLTDVTVRVGAAEQVARAGGGAATLGSTVVFGNDAPSLHEVAHEVTHVLQNRAGGGTPGRTVSAPHDAAEHEAESAGAQVSAGHAVEVGAAPAAALQLGPLDWLKGKKYGKRDADLVSQSAGPGASVNPVTKVQYHEPIAGGSTKGYFKPDAQSAYSKKGNSARAVASSRVDRALGFNQLSGEEFAKHGGAKGSVSADLGDNHVPMYEQLYQQKIADTTGHDPDSLRQIDGETFKHSGTRIYDHDLTNPLTQRSMADLQLQDAITGQKDRHGGNIMIDIRSGMAKGIDNDQAFDRGLDKDGYKGTSHTDGHYQGMPDLVDASSADKILAMKSKQFGKVVRGDRRDPERLSRKETKEAVKRFKDVKRHVKGLKKDGKLVQTWDASTHAQATAPKASGSYLKEADLLQQDAQKGGWFSSAPLPAVKAPSAPARPLRPDPTTRLDNALSDYGLTAPRRARAGAFG